MLELISAFSRSLRDLTRGDVLWQALWPPLVALAFWFGAGWLSWDAGIAQLERLVPQLPWQGWDWVSRWAAAFLMLAALGVLIYLTAVTLVAVFALPRLLDIVAARDYPELVRHGENVFWGSLANTLVAGLLFLAGGLLMLPLLLVPGMLLVLPLLLGAWLNQRTFRFDALAEHATPAELRRVAREQRKGFYIAGFVTAGAAHLPVVNLLVPAFTALVFVHYGLMALRQMRRQGGVEL